jgi:hypothetical protein
MRSLEKEIGSKISVYHADNTCFLSNIPQKKLIPQPRTVLIIQFGAFYVIMHK